MAGMLKKPGFYFGVLLAIFILYLVIPSGGSMGEYDSFASCLTSEGVVMYGTDWCPHCKNQKALFGKSFKKVDYVNCDKSREECLINGVEGYPTWKINSENYPGVRQLSELSSLSGCELVREVVE